ncbi:peptidoglycan DD-metalloendopeptidase family protein [Jeongeupia naejangsanensis]|uniref:Peptidoglycan DD-metalloendopeptidase family protein n=1 Tax=Jeongeupia naejangsanensis TaxID=613195 RepID=A0ABS2BFG6_9NEIS|nr:peptidoglycan DD-metalloendopeptidase family protein [Jeongeupia naejangsanensis]MBM3114346.1 peptidoglycan DD-metalloendopeptidase family protein [Jeongeupia naejangsanensis]
MSWPRLIAPTVLLLLAACTSTPRQPAPIVDHTNPTPTTPAVALAPAAVASVPAGQYMVKRGDTLYRIALDHGLAYRELASWNGLGDSSDIKVGQVLRLTPPQGVATPAGVEVRPLGDSATVSSVPQPAKPAKPASKSASAAATQNPVVAAKPQPVASTATAKNPASSASAVAKTPEKSTTKPSADDADVADWVAPTSGKPGKGFTDESRGVDIPGKMGQSIVASASGKVVYAGAGLRGYGKMLIIKHNKEFLSAYAHNSKLLVKEGDSVKKGEKIAEMGNTDADQVKLHFEIRRFGKPVDPAKYIQLE